METRDMLKKKYEYVSQPQGGWFLVRKGGIFDGRYGFVHWNMEQVIEPRFELAYPFRNGMALVKESGNWNYVSQSGKLVFDSVFPRFENGYLVSDISGFVPVRKNGKWGVMDRNNMLVVPMNFDEPVRFRQIGIYLRRLESQEAKWADREGNELSSLPIERLNERIGFTPIEYRIPDPHEFCWYCLDVATSRIGSEFQTFTLGGEPLPREIQVASMRVDMLGGSDYPNNPAMRENWIKFLP